LNQELLAASLQGRMKFHLTRYGPGVSDLMTRGWITFDGLEVVSCSTIKQVRESYRTTGTWYSNEKGALDDLHAQGIFTRDEFVEALEEHVRDPISVVLKSANPLARAIALCERRIGKRTLGKLVLSDTELQLVKSSTGCDAWQRAGLKRLAPIDRWQRTSWNRNTLGKSILSFVVVVGAVVATAVDWNTAHLFNPTCGVLIGEVASMQQWFWRGCASLAAW
jgi:hypothetical protein